MIFFAEKIVGLIDRYQAADCCRFQLTYSFYGCDASKSCERKCL